MATTDLRGRHYARLGQLKAGDTLEADDGFPCIDPHAVLTVEKDEHGLFVECRGPEPRDANRCHHYLDGQLDGKTDALIGFYQRGS